MSRGPDTLGRGRRWVKGVFGVNPVSDMPLESVFEDREMMVLAATIVALAYAWASSRADANRGQSRRLYAALGALVAGLLLTNLEAGTHGPLALFMNIGEHLAYVVHTLLLGWFLAVDLRERGA